MPPNSISSIHSVVGTEDKRWVEVVVRRGKDTNDTVHVYAWTPKDAQVALEKWREFGHQLDSPRYHLHIVEKDNVWGIRENTDFSSQQWNGLWQTMSEKQLLPFEYKDSSQ